MKNDIDFNQAVEITAGVFWVGQYIHNDPFQCHAYFIDNGDESVLVDPGSMLEFDSLIRKLKSIKALKKIRYIILHHQDPDLAASVPAIEKIIDRKDLQIITHSRMTALIKHYLIRSDYYEIDKHDYQLTTVYGLQLQFITTPYCHSPGAFVTYEAKNKVLFSSDIFGGMEESWSFYADQNYFQYAKAFHAEYMPGKDIFNYSLNKISRLDIQLIAPQHGSLIEQEFISGLIQDLKELDCGLYIEPEYNRELLDVIQELEKKDLALKQKQLKLQQQQSILDYKAHHDDLTNLPNRILFLDRLEQAICHADRHNTLIAVLFIDLDRFKYINDSFGHHVGDSVLQEVAKRLKNNLRAVDSIGRLGGDEFCGIFNSLHNPQEVILIVEKLIDIIKLPFIVQGHEVYVTSSVGISIYPYDAKKAEILMRNADAAMYKAKEEGVDNYQFYTRKMTEQAVERILMERELRHAIEKEEFTLFYQPQINVHNDQIMGIEALVRWQHEKLGLIAPNKFIPLAEETGLIIPLGEQIIHMASKQMAHWMYERPGKFRLAINLSAKQLQDKNIVNNIVRILRYNECKPEWIELEVTESYIMSNPEHAIRILRQLQNLGIRISIDDFGTGYSSLAYLKRLPINTLKIDRSFIRDISNNEEDRAIVTSIISMAQSMKLNVIAEGVETTQQKLFLQNKGCKTIQGFINGYPLIPNEMYQLLEAEPIIQYG